MYRFTFEEARRKYTPPTEGQPSEAVDEYHKTDALTTTSKAVMAGVLRAKADELDPPQRPMR